MTDNNDDNNEFTYLFNSQSMMAGVWLVQVNLYLLNMINYFFYFNIVLLDMVLLIADDVAGSP
jgi:hypothetical protein